jgi:hypothetical protein
VAFLDDLKRLFFLERNPLCLGGLNESFSMGMTKKLALIPRRRQQPVSMQV